MSHRPLTTAGSAEGLDSPVGPLPHVLVRLVDGFAYSSTMPAAIAGALSLLASHLLDVPDAWRWAFFAAGGTFIIYSLDRLRDVERDRSTSPMRTRFILRNRRRLYIATGIVSIGMAAALLAAPLPIIFLCSTVGSVGLLHRRLKTVAVLKTVYVSFAWVAACVGIPWIASQRTDTGVWIAGILLPILAANLIASNLRDDEAATLRGSPMPNLWIARGMILLSIGITLAAPTPIRALFWIPIWEGLALSAFRPTERYGHVAVDGALLIGALFASVHLFWAA